MQLIHKDRSQEDKTKTCSRCGRTMHQMYQLELCPICMEMELFNQVKEYIRENDVHEQDVAEHFNIPLKKVREWIRDGRIQYKGDTVNKITGVNCKICGKPISFGNTCPECHSLEALKVVASLHHTENAAMHFLGNKEQK